MRRLRRNWEIRDRRRRNLRLTQEFILDGAIGAVARCMCHWDSVSGRHLKGANDRPIRRQSPTDSTGTRGLVPPQRPYHPAYHPWRWRDWRDFGTGPLGDMGCHKLSTVFKALKLRYPISVEATHHELGPEVYPRSFKVEYEFPGVATCPR